MRTVRFLPILTLIPSITGEMMLRMLPKTFHGTVKVHLDANSGKDDKTQGGRWNGIDDAWTLNKKLDLGHCPGRWPWTGLRALDRAQDTGY